MRRSAAGLPLREGTPVRATQADRQPSLSRILPHQSGVFRDDRPRVSTRDRRSATALDLSPNRGLGLPARGQKSQVKGSEFRENGFSIVAVFKRGPCKPAFCHA